VAARNIEYIELYAGDKKSSVDYFVSSFGFIPVAESRQFDDTGDKESLLLCQGDVRLIVTTGTGTRAFLEAHGDGVADIAFACDDADATRAAAIAAGAAPAGPSRVRGFGAVCHTLVPFSSGNGSDLPAGRSWLASPPASAGGARAGARVQSLDHVAICVEGGSLETYAGFYRAAFGLERYSGEYVDYGDQAMDSVVVRDPSERITFTLVAPDPAKGSGQLDAFLDRNGDPGVQHLAFQVEDIVTAVAEFRATGVEFLQTPDTYYDMLMMRLADLHEEIVSLRGAGVLADRDEWGYLFQIFTRSPYERNTMFYELIQRRGARGFGSSNIRALYEAVDRTGRLAAG
jgi:4-hydroxymandelate synthase